LILRKGVLVFRRILCGATLLMAALLALGVRTRSQEAVTQKSSVSVDVNVKAEALTAQPVGQNWLSSN
jgi:hypothetical protein